MNEFWMLPIWARAAAILFVPVCCWFVFGRVVLWIFSVIPFLLRQFFRFCYFLLEIPVTGLHQKLGKNFYKIENALSQSGQKIDEKLNRWYLAWHKPQKKYMGIAWIIYLILFVLVGVVPLWNVNVPLLNFIETRYLACEESIAKWAEKHGLADSEAVLIQGEIGEGDAEEIEASDVEKSEITLVVSGVKTALRIRDIPSMKTDVVLARVHEGDHVIWDGHLAFSKGENGSVELWAKITTEDGIEGWSRLSYLVPKKYKNKEFFVTEIESDNKIEAK